MSVKNVTTQQERMNMINLLEIASQLALTAKGLQKKVDTDGSVLVTASQLAAKIPELKVLDNLVIFRLRKLEDSYKADTLCVYINDDGIPAIYSPDLTELTDFKAICYKSGISGYVDIEHTSRLKLKIGISVNDDYIIELEENDSTGIEGDDLPLPQYLKLVPQPETPLHSNTLPHNEEIEILSNGKKSRKFETPLVTVKLLNGTVVKDVICNATLERICEKYGNGAKFKIVGKHTRKNKQGQSTYIVDIVDCQGMNFADL